MSEKKINQDKRALSEPFGSSRPSKVYQWMISYLHNEKNSVLQRMLAPIARKLVVKFSDLPVDIVAGGLSLRCQFTDNYSEKKYVFTPWRYDRGELQALKNALPEDGVFIDIGANVGLYTLTAAGVLGGKGRILAFEPNPPTLQRLNINLAANRKGSSWPDIQVLNIGVADENGERVLQVDEDNLGASSIAKTGQSAVEEKIQCRILLEVLQEQKISRIDALKIDIEGAEDIALVPFIKQADDTLLPKLILIENSQDKWSEDLFGLLADKGYERIIKTRLNSVLERNS
ncbi:MAG: FkbM family methyltransferase [Gammaproteobacteria bacterium]|nr:FkbM family methyltransferase [Gammaproteobacteria bacterium]